MIFSGKIFSEWACRKHQGFWRQNSSLITKKPGTTRSCSCVTRIPSNYSFLNSRKSLFLSSHNEARRNTSQIFSLGKTFCQSKQGAEPHHSAVQHHFKTSTIRLETVRHFQATAKLPSVWHILHNSNIFHCAMHSPPRRGHSTHNCIYFVHLEICPAPRWRCETSSRYTLFDESETITMERYQNSGKL